jgi:serine O-acetyltransferase
MTALFNPRRSAPTFPGLGGIAAELHALRAQSHQTRYGAGPLPALPSRLAMTEVVDRLIAALFPRHFGPSGLSGDSVDAFVTFALASALQTLEREVRLELELVSLEAGDGAEPVDRAHEIAGAFATALPAIRRRLETDIRAAYEGDPAATSLDEVMCCYPGIAAIIRHRLAHELYELGAPMLARIISEIAHSLTGIDIHPGAAIGEGFFIDHGTGVVIGETAVIGRNVRLYQGVTLGARRFEVDETGSLAKSYLRHPILEDEVIVYAGASILGRITIGRGSIIAGSVWLTHSVPPGSRITQAKIRNDLSHEGGDGI